MLWLLSPAVVGSVLLATLSTIADYVWFLNIPQHQVASGMTHGVTLFAALGVYLGWRKGMHRVRRRRHLDGDGQLERNPSWLRPALPC